MGLLYFSHLTSQNNPNGWYYSLGATQIGLSYSWSNICLASKNFCTKELVGAFSITFSKLSTSSLFILLSNYITLFTFNTLFDSNKVTQSFLTNTFASL